MKTIHPLIPGLALVVTLAMNAGARFVSEPGHAPFYTTIPEGMAAAQKQHAGLAIKYFTDW